ncbi:MAG: hypothetical protein KDB22_23190 [Planctomycetales bacterium]|nr:hypothetical protein [Planctomycetales bacterium]
MTITKEKMKTANPMSDIKDAKRLRDLLDRQSHLLGSLKPVTQPEQRIAIEKELNNVRRQCIELVDRYFRQVLHPILRQRFPGKITDLQTDISRSAPVNVVVQFTQLVNDFFVQVLDDPKFDNPFWKKQTLVELRNYASIAISHHGLIDALRRRKKQEAIGDDGVRQVYEDQIAIEVEQQLAETGIDPADAAEVINDWEEAGNRDQQKYARLLRLHYITGMSMEQVAADMDLNIKTAYRVRQQALTAVRAELSARS